MSNGQAIPPAASALAPEQRADAWSATAPDYDAFSQQVTLPFAEDAARLVRIGPGTRVLDVGAGTGNFAFAAARRGAKVLATDFAPGMVDLLGRKVRAQGLAQSIDTAVMDGQALDLPDASFDVAASIFGLIFFPGHDRGLRELLRVLVPGGRAVVSTWAPPPRGDMSRLLGLAMSKAMPNMPAPFGPPHWAKLGDADAFRERLLVNGFARAHVVEIRHAWVFDTIEAFTETMPKAAPGAVAMFASMTAEQRAAFTSAIADDLRARQGDGPYAITHEALIAVGTKSD
ncbi:MAG TPA: methyltransferase domain-containing protein [Acidimicrobiia bacterium]|nr:methyltransferase domain-containing protein [Acidimicrobiia bacterium]